MRRATVLLFAALMASTAPAWAQSSSGGRLPNPQPAVGPSAPEPQDPSTAPGYDPWNPTVPRTPGIQAGAFTIFPSITAGALFDDNVFATNSNRRSDWAAIVRPEIGFRTSGPNYLIEGGGFIEAREYARFNSEDQINGSAVIGGTFMPDSDTQLVGRLRYTRAHEDRGGGESLFTLFDEPVGYNLFEATGAFNRRFGRLWTSIGVAGTWINFDTPTVSGVPVPQTYRDGNVGVLSARVGYVVAPLTSLFVEVAGNQRNFDVNRFDSTGYRVVGGVLLEPGKGANIKGEAYVGYMNQDYTGVNFQTVSTFTYGGALAWVFAPRWTAVFEGRRQALESALNNGVSLVESLIGARVDYAIAPQWVVGAGATYLIDDFQGVNRSDRTLSPLVSVKYLASPFLTLGFDYRYVNFDSSGFGPLVGLPYYRNVFLLSLNAKL